MLYHLVYIQCSWRHKIHLTPQPYSQKSLSAEWTLCISFELSSVSETGDFTYRDGYLTQCKC